jgi:hypothetical protein
LAPGGGQCFGEQAQVARAIVVIEGAWQPVVAAFYDLLGDAGKAEACQACHAGRMRPGSQSVRPRLPEALSESLATCGRKWT